MFIDTFNATFYHVFEVFFSSVVRLFPFILTFFTFGFILCQTVLLVIRFIKKLRNRRTHD